MKLPRFRTNNSRDRLLNMVRKAPRKEVDPTVTKDVLKSKVCRLCSKTDEEVKFHLGTSKYGISFENRCTSCKKKMRREMYLRDRDLEILRAKTNYRNNRERYAKRIKIRMRDDPNFAFRVALGKHNKRLYEDGIKLESFDEILGCTIREAREHFEQKFEPGMSWQNHGEWHIDHIRPLASFDLTDSKEREKAGHYTNLQPLWAKDNLSKGCKYDEDL
jgi:hypothetical protein